MEKTLNYSLINSILKRHSLDIAEKEVISYLEAQINVMPDYMRIFISLFNFIFDKIFLLFYLSPFRKLSLDRRIRILDYIKRKEIPLFALYIKLFETITLIKSLEDKHNAENSI